MWSGATLIFCVPEDSVLFSLLAPPSVCVAVWQLATDALTMPAAPPMASRVALNLHAIVQARVPRRSTTELMGSKTERATHPLN